MGDYMKKFLLGIILGVISLLAIEVVIYTSICAKYDITYEIEE